MGNAWTSTPVPCMTDKVEIKSDTHTHIGYTHAFSAGIYVIFTSFRICFIAVVCVFSSIFLFLYSLWSSDQSVNRLIMECTFKMYWQIGHMFLIFSNFLSTHRLAILERVQSKKHRSVLRSPLEYFQIWVLDPHYLILYYV